MSTFFDKIKMSARDYIGAYENPDTDLTQALCSLTDQKGVAILLDPNALPEAMRAAGVPEEDVLRVCLMTKVDGYREIMKKDPRTEQLDLDRYIQNATQTSGLNRQSVLYLAGALAKAAGIGMSYVNTDKAVVSDTGSAVRQLAEKRYERDLNEFGTVFERVKGNSKAKDELDFTMVEALANVGIPRARYYMGYCLLHGLQLEEDEETGVELLKQAAADGDSLAGAELGDYYFHLGSANGWAESYRYYTGYGAAAMTGERKKNLRNIFNHKIFNRGTLVLCYVLFALTLLTVVLAPGSQVYGTATVFGILALLVEAGLMGLVTLLYRNKPYDDLYAVPVVMTGIWFVYMAILLLF